MMRLALVALLAAGACRPSLETKPNEEVVVPKMPVDAAPIAAGDASASASAGSGWLRTDAQLAPKYTDRAEVLAAMKKATHRALLVHEDTIEECSGMGGSHAFFTMLEPAKGVVHYGGHGAMLMNAFRPGEIWVASYEKLASPESVKNEAWCVPDRVIDAKAIAMVPASSREEGERLLRELAR